MSHPESGRRRSQLDELIAPEIVGDRFHRAIVEVAATAGVREILEIGSSSGGGRTEAWVAGELRNPVRPRLHWIEVSTVRYRALVERWRGHYFVHADNVSSVPLAADPAYRLVERGRWARNGFAIFERAG